MKISSKNGWFQLFSTHPQLEERIDALRRATRF
jgi:Zn-dependent protease with chaperone function